MLGDSLIEFCICQRSTPIYDLIVTQHISYSQKYDYYDIKKPFTYAFATHNLSLSL